jgi:hypothetical protein
MAAAERYHRKAEECVALAKAALLNEDRARLYALAEYYIGLGMNEAQGDMVGFRILREEDATVAEPEDLGHFVGKCPLGNSINAFRGLPSRGYRYHFAGADSRGLQHGTNGTHRPRLQADAFLFCQHGCDPPLGG